MSRVKGRTSSKLFEEYPHIKKHYWGRHFWARGYFCATVGEMTEEMIKEYLAHHFELRQDDGFELEPTQTHRLADAYPDFQSITLTHQLLAGGC